MSILLGLALATAAPAGTMLSLDQPCVLADGAVLGKNFRGQDTRALAKSLAAASTPKDEFESTQQYEGRIASAVAAQPAAVASGQLCVVAVEPLSSWDGPEYDADAQVMWVPIEELLRTSSIVPSQNPREVYVAEVVAESWGREHDTHMASNAYGATVEVSASRWKEAAVAFDPSVVTAQLKASPELEPYAKPRHYTKSGALRLSMDGATAREIKDNILIAYSYKLRAPYVLSGARFIAATLDSPTQLFIEKTEVMATLTGLAVIDKRTGAVLKALTFQDPKPL